MYLGAEEVRSRSYAEATQTVIDEEVGVTCCAKPRQRALSLLGDHRDALDRLVEDLLAHETVDGDAVQGRARRNRGPHRARRERGPGAGARVPGAWTSARRRGTRVEHRLTVGS